MAVIERRRRGAPRRVLLCHVMRRADVFRSRIEPDSVGRDGHDGSDRGCPVARRHGRFLMLPALWTAVHPRAARRPLSNPNAATASRDVGMNGARFGGMVGRDGHGRTVLEWAIAMDLRNDNPCATAATSWTGASSAASTWRSARRSASGTRTGCCRRACAPRRGPRHPGRGAGPGAALRLHPPGRHGPHPPGQVDLVPRRRADLADRAAVVVAPGHGGTVLVRRQVVVIDARPMFRTSFHDGLPQPTFGHSFHKGLSAPLDHGATDLGVGEDLEPVLAEPSCREECTLSDPGWTGSQTPCPRCCGGRESYGPEGGRSG